MQQTFQTHEGLNLDVSVPAGSLEISGSPDVTETTVEIERLDRSLDPSDVECTLRHEGASLEVKIGRKRFRDGRYRVVVRTHEGTNLDISTGAADVHLDGAFGACRYRSGSGDLEAGEFRGRVNMKTGGGHVRLSSALEELSVEVASGSVTVGTAHGRASIHVVSGNLEVGEARGDLTARSVSGNVRIGSVARGAVSVNSVSGDVEIGILPGLRTYLDVHSVSGGMRSDLDVGSSPHAEGGPEVELRAKTVSGDVTIRRAAQQVA